MIFLICVPTKVGRGGTQASWANFHRLLVYLSHFAMLPKRLSTFLISIVIYKRNKIFNFQFCLKCLLFFWYVPKNKEKRMVLFNVCVNF